VYSEASQNPQLFKDIYFYFPDPEESLKYEMMSSMVNSELYHNEPQYLSIAEFVKIKDKIKLSNDKDNEYMRAGVERDYSHEHIEYKYDFIESD
jgi:hypothetical protein